MTAGRESVTVAAVDLGASSGRVGVGRIGLESASLEEVHRFANEPVMVAGTLYWDVLSLFRGIVDGLRVAAQVAGPLDAVGVDSWAVDYGLLDSRGALLSNPVHYRDGRTAETVRHVLADVGSEPLYAATGIQHQPFNTVFQLLSDQLVPQASRALLIPDLINYWLCGAAGTELTNASTTALMDPRTRDWSAELAERLHIRTDLFPPIHQPGTVLGPMDVAVCEQAGLQRSPLVVAVPSHDTAAAVAGVPSTSDRFAYACTGTWALVGVELPEPVVTDEARAANFTNELGADGTVRFLRNVTGFWLQQECIRGWRREGEAVDLTELTRLTAEVPALRAVIDVQDPRFAAPGDMPSRIRDAAGAGLATPAEVNRCILDSMALAIRRAVGEAVRLSDRPVDVVHVVGGGVANPLFCQLLADACQRPVLAGPTEAAVWGNALSQAQALGLIAPGLAASRAVIRTVTDVTAYEPTSADAVWRRADAWLAGREVAAR
jgi:rhamnulokinase